MNSTSTEMVSLIKNFHAQSLKLPQHTDFFISSQFKMGSQIGGQLTINRSGPGIKTVKLFLMDFRFFIMNNEKLNFNNVCNQIYRNISDGNIRENIKRARERWSELLERKGGGPVSSVRLIIDNEVLKSEKNIDMWLNGEFFHHDLEKKILLEKLHQTPAGELSFFNFVIELQNLGQLLIWFDENVVKPLLPHE